MADDEKKIIIDEDWKQQAQKEKEVLKEKEAAEHQASPEEQAEIPPADFSGLVNMLASQAFWALGVLRVDENDKRKPDFQMAKFNIDMLGVIEEKSKGNLSDDEAKMLEAALSQLRMTFVQLSK
ncbi:MAG: DUF1844 domain-containing protein [Phycisphaerae bacterium]|nr:DUF1844 domain-containing protein [Phycisphaerae bacterium]